MWQLFLQVQSQHPPPPSLHRPQNLAAVAEAAAGTGPARTYASPLPLRVLLVPQLRATPDGDRQRRRQWSQRRCCLILSGCCGYSLSMWRCPAARAAGEPARSAHKVTSPMCPHPSSRQSFARVKQVTSRFFLVRTIFSGPNDTSSRSLCNCRALEHRISSSLHHPLISVSLSIAWTNWLSVRVI